MIFVVIRLEVTGHPVNAIFHFTRCPMLCGILITAVLLVGCQNKSNSTTNRLKQFPPNLETETASLTNTNLKSRVQLYFDTNKIHLIQIETWSRDKLGTQIHGNSIASIVTKNGDTVIAPLRPDGTRLRPSHETVVTEAMGDKWDESTIHLTRSQWQRYLDGNPQNCSIKSLKAFTKANPENAE